MENFTIGAGIVTYNRKKLFIECFNSLLNQSYSLDFLYIFDNASNDGTSEWINDFLRSYKSNKPQIIYLKSNENGGSSLGFYELSSKMFNDGIDYILITDDDVIFEKDYIKKFLKYIKQEPENKIFTSLMVKDFESKEIKGESPIFAGGIINKEVFKKCGFPRKDFFIYWDDVEFILRTKEAGYKIRVCQDIYCIHDQKTIYPNIKIRTINFLGKKIEFSNINEWKLYYAYRNMIITLITHRKFGELFIKIFKLFTKTFILVLIGEFKKSLLILWGLKDGFLMRTGKNEKVFNF
jgi:rhamnopyranosyl-N-acetylglucosaminyl-diphospho-decaprenol beta-1,3/1,4-galactofuranosyltransferase